MKAHKTAGYVLAGIGVLLILSAVLLFFRNKSEDKAAGEKAKVALENIQAIIYDKSPETKETKEKQDFPITVENTLESGAECPESSADITVIEIDGYEYIGYISVPALNLELPVMAEWDYSRLQTAPCRQSGSALTDDMVIAAHNYSMHFGALKNLKQGDAVIFTNADGTQIIYSVAEIKVVDPKAVDAVINSGFDLVLYTCTYSGSTRLAVFCSRCEIQT